MRVFRWQYSCLAVNIIPTTPTTPPLITSDIIAVLVGAERQWGSCSARRRSGPLRSYIYEDDYIVSARRRQFFSVATAAAATTSALIFCNGCCSNLLIITRRGYIILYRKYVIIRFMLIKKLGHSRHNVYIMYKMIKNYTL